MVAEDPTRTGLLYAGTEDAVFFSLDDGMHWHSLQTDLPHVPAYWLTVQPEFHDLVLATYGRGIWILDDTTPIEQLNARTLAAAVHLFQPRDPFRLQDVAGRASEIRSQMRTEDPPAGVALDYWLGAPASGPVTLEALDSAGQVVRTLDGTRRAGLNRVWWDLRYQPRETVTLRMPPPNAPWRIVPPEGLPSQQWGGQFRNGPQVVPGTYTIRLSVDGQQQTRRIRVRKDPNSKGTLADIRARSPSVATSSTT
jgi:flagellar hook assembly protein FlgD